MMMRNRKADLEMFSACITAVSVGGQDLSFFCLFIKSGLCEKLSYITWTADEESKHRLASKVDLKQKTNKRQTHNMQIHSGFIGKAIQNANNRQMRVNGKTNKRQIKDNGFRMAAAVEVRKKTIVF